MGASAFVRVGNDGEPNRRPNRSLIKFDFLSGLLSKGVTDASQIVDAWIVLQIFSSEGGGTEGLNVDIFRLRRDWTEGETAYAPAAAGEVTWTAAKFQNEKWSKPGAGDIVSDRWGTADDTQFISSIGKVTFNVKGSLQAILASGENYGWLLQAQDESKDKYHRYYSSEHRKTSRRPKLVVVAEVVASTLAKNTVGARVSKLVALGLTRSDALLLPQTLTDGLPREFALAQNYPNPFNPETTIRYSLPGAATLSLTIFDITGREIRKLIDAQHSVAGNFSSIWDGRDNFGRPVASGAYFYRIVARANDARGKPFVQTRSMILLK